MLTPPKILNAEHNIKDFDCGKKVLDDWLKKRALANQASRASRTFVVCDSNRVVGYYALAMGSVSHEIAHRKVKQNMPKPVPVMVLARLAVDLEWKGQGVGRSLVRDAMLRTLNISEQVGCSALLVHAIDDDAKSYYENLGLYASPIEPLTLMVTLKEIEAMCVPE